MWRALRIVGVLAALALVVAVLAAADRDPSLAPQPGERPVRVHVVDHGYHVGLVVSAADIRRIALLVNREAPDLAHVLRAVAADYPAADWLEFGWGDAGFYRGARSMGDVSVGMAATALLVPSPSVLQVVPGWGEPASAFGGADVIALDLSEAGAARLGRRLADTFARDARGTPQADGASLYGMGAFYAAVPDYHLLNTCNHWASALLRAAGLPSSWLFSMTSAGLMAELEWRMR